MYAIYIPDPANFSASTVGGATWDTQLWLFDSEGKGVVFNDDAVGTTVFQSRIDNSTGCLTGRPAGVYYLAISRYNRDAVGCGEGTIWADSPFRAVRCPDGTEPTSRVAGWTGATTGGVNYTITLVGAEGATAGDPADCPPFDGWDETANGGGDAGDQIETSQKTGSNPIPRIRGTIGAANDVDIYAIYIEDPQNFSASTIGGTALDTALWLFDADGKGVLHNEDNPDASTGFQSRIDNRGGQITQPGIYYLAISLFGRRAIGCEEGLIWSSASTFWRQIIAPNGAEPNSRLAGWTGSTTATGRYIITLTGVRGEPTGTDPADCPPPAPWDEQYYGRGDAGDLPANAQIVTLAGQTPCQSPVNRIRGDNGTNDVDMYVIYISDPANFVASTIGTTTWDTQLWLFRCDGTGVLHNDDSGGTLQSRIDNTPNCITAPGVYLLAISRYNRDAVDASGNLLWSGGALACPNGPGAANPVAGWTGSTTAGGRYIITLQGAYFVTEQGCAGTCPGQCEGDVNRDGTV
ncbi:MAG: DVUA0089 family protein, partial [Fimbriimonadales bacterium]|nr:DVUA0089 family protein [Fimbriimonadales bacterium]